MPKVKAKKTRFSMWWILAIIIVFVFSSTFATILRNMDSLIVVFFIAFGMLLAYKLTSRKNPLKR